MPAFLVNINKNLTLYCNSNYIRSNIPNIHFERSIIEKKMKLIDLSALFVIATSVASQITGNDDAMRNLASMKNGIKQANDRIAPPFENQNIKSRNLILKRYDNENGRGDKIDGAKCDGYCHGRCDDKRIQGVCQGKCYGYCYKSRGQNHSAPSSKSGTYSKTKSELSSTRSVSSSTKSSSSTGIESSRSSKSGSSRTETESSTTRAPTSSLQTKSNSAASLKKYEPWYNSIPILLMLIC